MTLRECYAALGGDFEAVTSRFPNEKFVQKYLIKFLSDGSYDLLIRSMEEQDYQEAFRAAHTIKGVCQNLGLTRLLDSSSRLSEALRHGYTPEADGLAEQVGRDYQDTVGAIRAFQASVGS